MQSNGKTLNETFLPKTILRKTQMKTINPLLQKNKFEKTQGNIYVELDPPQIKFNGYEINKVNTLTFKIINKAPIPQRFNIIPPSQPHFSIKVNKKGNIPTGMYETVQVSFKATDYKYLYDVVKINTQTQNFVVPLYAYPSIPNLSNIFPKLIDFGNIQVKQTQSYLYPIKNPTPIDYKFQFLYKKQCSQIMINPLNGTIPGNGQLVIQMAFIPNRKMTYSSEVYFKMQQFDFQPIYIQIIGSGKQKDMNKTFKRLKSSKLVPLKDKQQQQQRQKQSMNKTQTFLNEKIKDNKKSFQTNIRKLGTSKLTYPKLLNSTLKQKTANNTIQPQNSIINNNQTKHASTINGKQKSLSLNSSSVEAKNTEQRQFLSRFNKVQQTDRQKQIKFAQYLGDFALTQQQIQFQNNITNEMNNFRSNLLKNQCETRYNPEKLQSPEVQYIKVKQHTKTWDQNKNDFIYERKNILNKFVIAASKIIQKTRILKRFDKIKLFLSDCSTKQQVTKKVQQSYQKSLDSHSLTAFNGPIELGFNKLSIQPTYMELQFVEGKQKFNERIFKTEGKTEFDDLTTLTLIQPYQNQKMCYNQISFPVDFVQLSKIIPPQRISGQQQFSVKSSSLPNAQPTSILSILQKPFQIPNHYFIHQGQQLALFKQYHSIDQKNSRYLFGIQKSSPIQDEFQGWSKGDMEVLKYKLLKNTGIQYTTSSAFNYSSYRNQIGFYNNLTHTMPQFIQKPSQQDNIQDQDSDEEKYQEVKKQTVDQFLDKIQVNPQVKARRQKKQIEDEDKKNRQKIQRNLQKDKLKKITPYIQKIKNINKLAQRPEHQIVL